MGMSGLWPGSSWGDASAEWCLQTPLGGSFQEFREGKVPLSLIFPGMNALNPTGIPQTLPRFPSPIPTPGILPNPKNSGSEHGGTAPTPLPNPGFSQNLEMHDRIEHLIEQQVSRGGLSARARSKSEYVSRSVGNAGIRPRERRDPAPERGLGWAGRRGWIWEWGCGSGEGVRDLGVVLDLGILSRIWGFPPGFGNAVLDSGIFLGLGDTPGNPPPNFSVSFPPPSSSRSQIPPAGIFGDPAPDQSSPRPFSMVFSTEKFPFFSSFPSKRLPGPKPLPLIRVVET